MIQTLLQPIVDQLQTLLQPLYDTIEQLRFWAALIINAIAALCFAQTFEPRATTLSRVVYLLVLWLFLPPALSLFDSFYGLFFFFDNREDFAAWLWLAKPLLLGLIVATYLVAAFFAGRRVAIARRKKDRYREHIFDCLFFLVATALMLTRFCNQIESNLAT